MTSRSLAIRFALSCGGILLAAGCVTGDGPPPPVEGDPDLTDAQSEVATDGAPLASSIPGGGWRTHTLAVAAQSDITAVLDWSRAAVNLNLFLYDPSGALVAAANGTATRPEEVSHAGAEPGTWVLGIKNKSSQLTSYTLSVTATANAATIFGESLGGHGTLAQSIQYSLDRFGRIPVARMYFGEGAQLAASWDDSGMLRALPAGTHVVVSFKPTGYGATAAQGLVNIAAGAADSDIVGLLSSRPSGVRVWLSLFHEPEDDYEAGDFTSAQYKNAWARVGQVVRSIGDPEARSALILMRFTLSSGSGRDWHDFYTASGPDVFAWDAYNFANNPSPSRYQSASEILDPIIAVANQTGKPWGIAEFGSALADGDGDGSGRAAWLTSIANKVLADGRAEFFTYWDRQSLYTVTDYTLADSRSIQAWRALSNREPSRRSRLSESRIRSDDDLAGWGCQSGTTRWARHPNDARARSVVAGMPVAPFGCMPLVESLARVAVSHGADAMTLESGRVPTLIRGGETIPLAMGPLGAEMFATVLAELLEVDERAAVERGGAIDARATVLGFRARVEAGATGPALTLRSPGAPAPVAEPASRVIAHAPTPSPPAAEGGEPPIPSDTGAVLPTGPLGELFAEAVARGASDVFLSSQRARARIDGELADLDGSGSNGLDELRDLLDPGARARLAETGSVDLALVWQDHRLRTNVFHHSGGLAAAVRIVDERGRSLAELGVPSVLASLVRQPSGLVLIAGLAGHGKSTTLGALVDSIDQAGARHVITLEDPIERRFRPRRGLVHQREVGRDVESFAAGLRAALRESPDVIVVGEMRDPETIAAALTAAETGHLVLSTVHAATPATVIDRVIDGFSAASAPAIRAQLATVLRAVATQRLLPGRRGGRVPAFEVLQVTTAVAALIRDDRGHQLVSAIQTGKADGMITLEASLARLVTADLVERSVALAAARDRAQLSTLLAAQR